VTGTTEARSVFVLLVALFALAVPAAAAFPASKAAETDPAPHMAAALALMENAPTPLIVMAIGLAIVTFTVMRRVRRSGLGSNADRS